MSPAGASNNARILQPSSPASSLLRRRLVPRRRSRRRFGGDAGAGGTNAAPQLTVPQLLQHFTKSTPSNTTKFPASSRRRRSAVPAVRHRAPRFPHRPAVAAPPPVLRPQPPAPATIHCRGRGGPPRPGGHRRHRHKRSPSPRSRHRHDCGHPRPGGNRRHQHQRSFPSRPPFFFVWDPLRARISSSR